MPHLVDRMTELGEHLGQEVFKLVAAELSPGLAEQSLELGTLRLSFLVELRTQE